MPILVDILSAAQRCLDSAKVLSSVRSAVRKHLPDYEECLDVSLSQQCELLSGFMFEYVRLSEETEYDAEEVGEEPYTHEEAIHLLDPFLGAAREAVSHALESSEHLFGAMEIGLRAQTFASILRSREVKK